MNDHNEITVAAAKAAPPIAITSGSIMGIPLPDLLLWLTLIYTVVQLGLLAPRVVEAIKKGLDWLRS